MKKIPTLFCRNHATDHLVRNEVTPGCEWVLAGEGVATKKYDGTCCMIRQGQLWKRYELKSGKTPPPTFLAAQDPDPVTGKTPGWVLTHPVEDPWHVEAWQCCKDSLVDGTYELCGPKINGNPEGFTSHLLIKHGLVERRDAPRDFEGLRKYLLEDAIEGLVWHHPDGRMAKLKLRDFGYTRRELK